MFTHTPPCEAGPGHSARGTEELAYAFPSLWHNPQTTDGMTGPHPTMTLAVGFLGSAVDNG